MKWLKKRKMHSYDVLGREFLTTKTLMVSEKPHCTNTDVVITEHRICVCFGTDFSLEKQSEELFKAMLILEKMEDVIVPYRGEITGNVIHMINDHDERIFRFQDIGIGVIEL